MPNPTFRRWTADDIVQLKNFAQMQRGVQIAQERGRTEGAAKAGGKDDSERQQEAAQAQGR